MLSTKEEIIQALNAYQAHISARNRQALETYIPLIANAQPTEDDDDFDSDEKIAQARLNSLSTLLATSEPVIKRKDEFLEDDKEGDEDDAEDAEANQDVAATLISKPEDILTRYEELIPWLGLDGVIRTMGSIESPSIATENGHPVTERNKSLAEYFDTIERHLKENCLPELRDSISIPEELRILAGLGVDGLDGPGIGLYKERDGAAFWRGLSEVWGGGFDGIAAELVKDAADGEMGAFAGMDDNKWVVGGGWQTGGGEGVICCALYCRGVDGQGGPDSFGWRYTFAEEGDYHMFDTMPELLGWYKSYREGRFKLGEVILEWVDDDTVFSEEW